MRKILVCTAVFFTAATFVAAEKLTSSTEQALALEMQEANEAALDEQIRKVSSGFSAEIAALKDEKESAQAQIASLTGTVEELTAARDDLTRQIGVEQGVADAIRETLAGLEASNSELMEEIEVKSASLTAKEAEVDALAAEVERLAQQAGGAAEPAPENDELVAEIASLNEQLVSRDETISTLMERIEAAEAGREVSSEETGEANPALAEELQTALATIEELREAKEGESSTMDEALRERDATIAELQAKLAEQEAIVASQSAESEGAEAQADGLEALSERLAELSQQLDSQQETISLLRMGFEEKPADPMTMASACIERANKIFEISQIKFGTGTSSISQDSMTTLDHLRDLAIGCENDDMYIEIGGHTDSLGAEADNQVLSEARAQSVRRFLIGRGIPEDTMVAVGYGEAQPIATNDTPAGRAQNRRITFTWQMREEKPENVDG